MWHKPYNPKDETCHHVVQSVCLSQELSYFVCVCLCTWLCHFQNAVYREVHLSYFHRFNHACLEKQGILQSAQKGQSLIERVGRDSCRHTHQYEFDSVVLLCGRMKIKHWLIDGSPSPLSHPSILGTAFTSSANNTDMWTFSWNALKLHPWYKITWHFTKWMWERVCFAFYIDILV